MAWINQLKSIKYKLELFHTNAFSSQHIPRNYESQIIQWFYSFHLHLQASTMDASKQWPFTCEYSIWNTIVTALQFWMVDLEPHILSNAIDWVYAALFYSDFTQQMQNLPEETLFSHFVTTLNNALETELAQEDEGYKSGSESCNIPTPLSRAPRIYHVSMMEDLSFYPANFGQSPTTTEQHEEHSSQRHRHHSFSCHWLVFTSSDDESPMTPSKQINQHSSTNARSPVHRRAEHSSPVHHNLCHSLTPTPNTEQFLTDTWYNDTNSTKENFPTAPLDGKIWSEDPIPLCIHETPHKPHHQCSYPFPYRNTTFRMHLPQSTPQDAAVLNYELMDFSDISSDLPDIIMTTSDNDIPDLVDISDSEHLDNIQHRVWFA